MTRVWIITGCSSGLGKDICLSALARGNRVIATCRGDPKTRLIDLIAKGADVLSLDVTAPLEELSEFMNKAISIHGHVDILCNNAGFVQYGAIEETSPEETLKQYQTSVFGPLNLTRAALPHMRERKAGTIAMIGSVIADVPVPGAAIYNSSKAALASLTATLAAEVAPFGITATCIEPGEFRTDIFAEPTTAAQRITEYDGVLAPTREKVTPNFKQPGDPHKAAERIVDLLTGHGLAKGRKVPSRILLGDDTILWRTLRAKDLDRDVQEWRDWSVGTNFDSE